VTGRRARTGFTLMEVMLALGVFGIVTTMLYGTFARTLRSKTIAEQRAEVTRLGRAALGRMADEIGSAYYPPGLVDTAIFRTLRGGTEEAPLDSLVFTALSARPAGIDGRGTDQRMLVYFFPRDRSGLRRGARGTSNTGASDDANLGSAPANRGGVDVLADDADDFFEAFGPSHPPILGASPHRLLRREATMIERRALDEARASVFLEDVASLNFSFHDGTDWVDEWDSEDPNFRHLPRAVRIELALYDETGDIHRFTTAVDLPMSDTPIGFGATKTPGDGASPRPTRTPKGGL
jgi:prepilin-type N-terminal cleavage/methylation domain-containing protein